MSNAVQSGSLLNPHLQNCFFQFHGDAPPAMDCIGLCNYLSFSQLDLSDVPREAVDKQMMVDWLQKKGYAPVNPTDFALVTIDPTGHVGIYLFGVVCEMTYRGYRERAFDPRIMQAWEKT